MTSLVKLLKIELKCAETTVWNSINQLKKIGIIDYVNFSDKAKTITLTKEGKYISECLEEKNE